MPPYNDADKRIRETRSSMVNNRIVGKGSIKLPFVSILITNRRKLVKKAAAKCD